MKKILGIVILAVLIIFSAGCVSNDENNGGTLPPVSGDKNLVEEADKIAKSFGSYNGKAIQWRVLAVDEKNEKALLLTKDCIAFKPFQNEGSPEQFTWETSDMRTWLNGEFYDDSFSETEKGLILKTQNKNPANSETGVAGCRDTADNVFLLSEKEVLAYFETDESMVAEYAPEGGAVQWWLRTTGDSETSFILIYETGGIYYPGSSYMSSYGVRPAVWVDLSDKSDEN